MTMKEDASGWIWGLVRGWFSPAVLFVLLNIVIGTIAVTSRAHRHRDRPAEDSATEGDPSHLSRASSSSSVLERLRSFGLYRFRSGDFPLDYTTTTTTTTTTTSSAADAEEPGPDPTTANLSDSAAAEEGTGRMKKSASASSAFEEARVVWRPAAAEEEVNARADDFINRFRQQLRLQRLNSLLNYK